MSETASLVADLEKAEDGFSVVYRTGPLTERDYDEAIEALINAKADLIIKSVGGGLPCCLICEDSGHTAESCHHNPLILARRLGRATNVWQCWHCGFLATTDEEAVEHFGSTDNEVAKCIRAIALAKTGATP